LKIRFLKEKGEIMNVKTHIFGFLIGFVILASSNIFAQQIEFLDAQPMTQVIQGKVQSVSSDRRVPAITWGGDVATILAEIQGIFKKEGLDVEVYTQNDFVKQVEDVLTGRTPYLRGTMGMINVANEVFERNGLKLRVIYQISWSNGDDAIVVRSHIRRPSDLRGKTIALQRYGPHMDYVANILQSAGVPLSSVNFKWLRELTLPTYDTKGKVVDPVSAFRQDLTIDAVMAIIPDALALTSDGKVGTGAEGSVKGAKILLTTQTANRIIADVYAVREDYYQTNRGKVEKFTHALMVGQEQLEALLEAKSQRQAEYHQLVARSADLLFGAPQATAEVEGLLAGGCYFVGHAGNVQFFTSTALGARTFRNLMDEIQTSFVAMGLLTAKSSALFLGAEWNFNALTADLTTAKAVSVAVPAFDRAKTEARVAKGVEAELAVWEEGTLFVVEVNFQPNQKVFTETQYADDFSKALKLVQTYGGALVSVEGHTDPKGLAWAKQKGESPQILAQMEQVGKNLSLDRANTVKTSFLAFAKKNGVKLDDSGIVSVGMGVRAPKFGQPKTKDEWLSNMRVVFRIKQVELSEFQPLQQEIVE